MKLLSLNCQSFSTAKQDLYNVVSTYDIDILCLSETWEKAEDKISFRNWKILSRPRLSNNHGGVAICAKQSETFIIERQRSLEKNNVEAICAEVTPQNGEQFLLLVAYIPPNKTDELKALLEIIDEAQKTYKNIVWTGDLNAKNKLWCNKTENNAGDILEIHLRNSNSVILNDGLPTRRNCQSVIDLVLATPTMVKKIKTTQTLLHENVRSDHIAILVNIDDDFTRDKEEQILRYQVQKTDWEAWDTTTQEEFSTWLNEQTDNATIEDLYQSFLETFEKCMEKCVPKKKITLNGRRTTPPWTNETTKKAKNELNKAQKHFKRRQTPELFENLKEKEDAYDTACTEAKTTWVEDTCKEIDNSTNPRDKWRAFHKLTTYEETDGGTVLPMMDDQNTPIFDRPGKCSLLQKTFFAGDHLKNEDFDENFKDSIEEEFKCLLENNTDSQADDFLNRELLTSEVEAAIQKMQNGKAAGPDEIYTDLLKKYNNTLLRAIQLLFEKSFEKGHLPHLWKLAKVKFIQKPGKESYYQPSSYRPISLTSTLGKCMERIVNSRLYAFAEHNQLIDQEQEGFREKRGTTHALLRLTQDILDGFSENRTTGAIFIDLEKAYDSVWREGLMVKLHKLGIGGKMWCWIQNFLQDREAVSCIGNHTSTPFPSMMGLPQGSVLSPLLFNLFLSDMMKDVQNQKVKFADDGTIWKTGVCSQDLEKGLQDDLDSIATWTKKWRMKLNTDKTEYCLFSKETQVDITITLKNKKIRRVSETKLLGVTLDEKLSFKSHIQKTVMKATKALGLLAKVGKTEKISVASMLKIYKSLVVPHLEYAAAVWHTSPHVIQLEKVQRQGLCICLGSVGTASCESLEIQANILPLALRREEIIIRECTKVMAKPSNSLIKKTLTSCQENEESTPYSRVATPMTNMLQLVQDMENVTEIETRCLETEFTYLEYMQPSRSRPTYWNNLGSSKNRSKAQEDEAKLQVNQILSDLQVDSIIAFTDGSCRGNPGPCGAGSCIYLPNDECIDLRQPVSKLASILVGELVAIKITLQAALDELKRRKFPTLLILSDSQTAIGILTLGWDCNTHSSLVLEIKLLWNQLTEKGVDISLQWTPGHAQIAGNERADKLAKEAAQEAEGMDEDSSQPVSQTDIKTAAKKMALIKWQRRWELSDKGRHLFELRQKVERKNLDFRECTNQKILLQLQNGHCKLLDHLHRVGLAESAGCECGMAETIEHYLMDCPRYAVARERMIRNISLGTDLTTRQVTARLLLTDEDQSVEKIHRQHINRELDSFISSTHRF